MKIIKYEGVFILNKVIYIVFLYVISAKKAEIICIVLYFLYLCTTTYLKITI